MNLDPASTRIAIVDASKCKPKRCVQECKKYCPVQRTGKLCVEVKKDSKISLISEDLCIGCGICIKKCPFEAIQIINLPKALDSETVHRYGVNSFKLHRLPVPRPGQVLGLVGTNGIGKSTALQILQGKLKPNLGNCKEPVPEWKDILKHFQGSELQNYLNKIVSEDLECSIKPQYVDNIPKAIKGNRKVHELMKSRILNMDMDYLIDALDLRGVLERDVDQLSGGELQRFAIAITMGRKANVFLFDEPSSYLDVKQRLTAARMIRSVISNNEDNYVICVEHDLAVIDYLSDFVCLLYGKPSAYGVVTMPFNVRDGINIFLSGFIPTENMRFREEELSFKFVETAEDFIKKDVLKSIQYPKMTKTMKAGASEFKLSIENGSFRDSQIIVLLGENGTGKTTFIRMLAGLLKSDEAEEGLDISLPELNVSYKPQTISPKFEGNVEALFLAKIKSSYLDSQFKSDVIKPFNIEPLLTQPVKTLSGGELQRVALVLALGKPADIYLIDEPSAYLDSEQRIIASKIIKRFIFHSKKTAFIVEHDFIMATYLADQVIVYTGNPGVDCTASSPQGLLSGMNLFLKNLEITFRRDPTNFRPRINKFDSVKDKEQKTSGNYFFLGD